MFRFTIRELVLLTVIVAMGVAWWLSNRRHLFPSPPYPIESLGSETTLYSTTLTEPYVVAITDKVVSATPRWDRSRYSDPPLAAGEAIKRADIVRLRLIKEGIVQQDPSDPYWVFSAAELMPYDLKRGLWYWLVRFDTGVDKSGPPQDLRLVVLMNGTVIEPTMDQTPAAFGGLP